MQRIQILLDISDGLAYLHLIHKSVHQDLKSPNILLEKNSDDKIILYRAKIGDFGMSKIVTKGKRRLKISNEMRQKSTKKSIRSGNWIEAQTQRGYIGTLAWMAPEIMKESTHMGPSSDIFSLGCILWEVWQRREI